MNTRIPAALTEHLAALPKQAATNNAWPKLVLKASNEQPLEVGYSIEDSALGKLILVSCDEGLCYLGLATDNSLQNLQLLWPNTRFTQAKHNHAQIARAISNKTTLPSINIKLFGRPLQLAVWQQLVNIPSGKLCTYSDVASAVGKPKAVRAVASCIGQNPITYLLPCHRVIAKSGKLGGYYWGLDVKQKLLAHELFKAELS